MRYKIIACALFLAIPVPLLPASAARLKSIETAYEVSASQIVTLSGSANGVLVLKPCADCKGLRLRLTPQTEFVVNGERVTRQTLRPAMRQRGGLVYVFVSDETGAVRLIELDNPGLLKDQID